MFKYLTNKLREYIFIILTATIFSTSFSLKSFSEENVFIIDNIEIEGQVDINFSREKYINKAFQDSFEILLSKILLSQDLVKLSSIKLNDIKNLIRSFQIINETYQNDIYTVVFKIFYNDEKVKKLLLEKNISYSEPKNISAIFFPAFFKNDKLINFSENYFYINWLNTKIKNELINFILPIEELDDISKIKEFKNKIEDFDLATFTEKYNINNYVFTMLDYQNEQLNVYLQTSFNNSKTSKNISYKIYNIEDEKELTKILKELKIIITDIWKGENIINLTIPLSIRIKFNHNILKDLTALKNTFYKISIIDSSSLEEFDINQSYFKIYYYGSPKRLSNELKEYGYHLKNDRGQWRLFKHE